ncbi:hypothetical protein Poly30_30860 [Planctomycetes bacterium Poly30]|uniref:Uncharacterized protein n=1 Tax=Saltatorellus ferox TaxID=2528018 RepID=A0A518ETZ8_9BACT|nr:hypothetical protein Poly30_30860 [Planctomycetes bacterium Poly30]
MKNHSYLQITALALGRAAVGVSMLAGTSFSLGTDPLAPGVDLASAETSLRAMSGAGAGLAGAGLAGAGLAGQDSEKSTTLGGIEFAHLSFDDAVSRAERTKKLLVVFWAGDAPQKEQAFGDRIFGDASVQRWMSEFAEPVRIDALDRKKDAKKNGLGSDLLPAIDILDVARGGRLDRLTSEASATQFLAAVFGSMSAEKPEGENANEPFSWLAWANASFRNGADPASGDHAVAAYDWCLLNADRYRPGFRAKYFEFLLQRLANCKRRSPRAIDVLLREHRRLAGRIVDGIATESDVYELTRVDFWTRQELTTRDLFVALSSKNESYRKYQEWLFPTVVPVLGRFEQYGEIVQLVGDRHLSMFQERIDGLSEEARTATEDEDDDEGSATEAEAEASDAESKGSTRRSAAPSDGTEATPEEKLTALDYALPDSRADIIEDASWVYEALLKAGRGKDAHDLMTLITTTFPVNKAFGLFMERALRVEIWSAAAEIADLGMAVLDERGQRRMQRLVLRIPRDAGK